MTEAVQSPAIRLGHFAQTKEDFSALGVALPDALRAFEQEAWQRFAKQGIPSTRVEDYKYTSLRTLNEQYYRVPSALSFASNAELPEALRALSPSKVYLENGDFVSSENLPKGVSVRSLRDFAESDAGAALACAKALEAGLKDPLLDLNLSFMNRGVVIDVAADTSMKTPLIIVNQLNPSAEAAAVMPLQVLRVGKQASVSIIEAVLGGNASSFMNAAVFTTVAESALVTVQHMQLLTRGTTLADHRVSQVARDAQLKYFTFDHGGGIVRHNHNVMLQQSGAHVDLKAVYLADASQHVDHHTTIDHMSPLTTSAQVYKGVLNDKARGVFNGKVIVRRDAQKSAAHQMNKTLLLSDGVEIDTKPELQIDADDIKCSHGATVGQLNRDELFYLQSRGITRKAAERLLGVAYVADLVDELSTDALNAWYHSEISNFFNGRV